MTQSLKDIIMKAVPEYYDSEFGAWITKWPGQVVLIGKFGRAIYTMKTSVSYDL